MSVISRRSGVNRTWKLMLAIMFVALVLSISNQDRAFGANIWAPQTSGTVSDFTGLSFLNASTGLAVTWSGGVYRTTNGGSNWVQTHQGSAMYSAVDYVDANNAWAVGTFGSITRLNSSGQGFSQNSGTTVGLLDVDFVNAGIGWAVGENGTILKTINAGSTWTPQASGTSMPLENVAFFDQTVGYAVGFNGTILRTTNGGTTWTSQTGIGISWLGVDMVDQNTAWVVGVGGAIFKTTSGGNTWIPQNSGTANDLLDVDFVDAQNGWAVGENGTILHTTNGGANWSAETSSTTSWLMDAHFIDANTGFAVGTGGVILEYTVGSSGGISVSAVSPSYGQILTLSVTAGASPVGGSVTNNAIDFGTLSADTPKTATQLIEVTTNAANGYNVKAKEDHELRSGLDNIHDASGDTTIMTEVIADQWVQNTTDGFGYTLANTLGSDASFTSGYKQFANTERLEAPQDVMSNTGEVAGSKVTVTYKLNVASYQPAGTYQNVVTYIATGNF